jgi:hypothetical protein
MTRTRVIRLIALVLAVLCGMLEVLCGHSGGNIAQGGGVEWETINEEAGDLNEAGKYDRGIRRPGGL